MLYLTVVGEELFDEKTNEFSTVGDVELELEHSLLSLSDWEQEFQKPFLGPEEKTREEALAYIEHMILNESYPDDIIDRLSRSNLEDINAYIDSPATATTFAEIGPKKKQRTEIITSELVYYWMIAYNIPFECQTWHLNRLFALIRICNIKNNPDGQKMSKTEAAARRKALNEQRKAKLGTRG